MKRSMSKVFLYCLLLIVLLFSACTPKVSETQNTAPEQPTGGEVPDNEAAPVEKVKLQMTIWGSNYDPEVYQARLDKFQSKNPNIEVELIYIPSDYSQKVQTMIAGGTAPDIIQLAEDVHAYSSKNQIIALNEYLDGTGVDLEARFGSKDGLVGAYSRDGSVYALPDRGGSLIMYYNKDMFDAAGISYPTPEWTWTEFLDAAQKMTIREGEEVIQYGFAAGDWWPWWMSFIYQNGGRVLDENGNPVFNSPETVEALQFYVDLVYKYNVAPSPEDFANMGLGGPDPVFAQGKAAMIMTGFWNVGGLKDVEGINWDIAPIFGQKQKATVGFGSGLAITSDCEHPEAAFQVINYLTDVEGQTTIAEMKQDAPANVQVLNSEAFVNADWSTMPISLNTMALAAADQFPLPLAPEWNEMQDIMGDHLSEVFLNKVDVATAVANIQEELEVLLGK